MHPWFLTNCCSGSSLFSPYEDVQELKEQMKVSENSLASHLEVQSKSSRCLQPKDSAVNRAAVTSAWTIRRIDADAGGIHGALAERHG